MQCSTWSEGRGLFVVRVLLAVDLAVTLLLGLVNRKLTFEGNAVVRIDGDMLEDEADQYDGALQET